MEYLTCAGIGYLDIAAAIIDRALVSEEFQGVVEDFYGLGTILAKLLRGFVEAVSPEGIAGLEHKIPVDVRSG